MDGSRRLQGDSIQVFSEGIGMVLYRWSALRTVLEWGGHDSSRKADQIATDILSWFTQSKGQLDIYDLEDILDEGIFSLGLEFEDDGVEVAEVAKKLMAMHEECLEGNFRSIEILREACLKQAAHPHVAQVVNGDEDDDEDEDGDDEEGGENDENVFRHGSSSNMDLDIPKSESDMNSVNMPVNAPPKKVVASEADDGWIPVSNRKNKGRKN